VRLGIENDAGVEKAFADIRDEVTARKGAHHFLGVSLQPMIKRDGYELIVGSTTDPQFGPVVLFGLGGTLTEVFRDTALALPGMNRTEAARLIDATRISVALKGIRGKRGVNLSLLTDILVRYSHMIVELPMVRESEINPLLAWSSGVIALDARFVLEDPQAEPTQRLSRLGGAR
jgi:acetyltransferase